MTIVRRAASVLLATAVLGLWVGILPAGAAKREGFTVRLGEVVEKSYGPIPGAYNFNDGRNTFTCEGAPFCDVIPIKIEPPTNLAADEDFLVSITLTWDYRKVNGTSTNNMDLGIHLGTNPAPPNGAAVIVRSQCCEPEKVQLLSPRDINYQLMVMNAEGVNTGYKLMGNISITKAILPDEFLGLEGGENFVIEDRSGEPFDFSGEPAPFVQSESALAQEFALAPIEPDPDFASLAAPFDFDDLLKGSAQFLGRPPEAEAPPRPVSASTVAIWGGVFPLVLVAGGWFALRTRNQSGLDVI
jgi:hypothetical protein